MDCDSFNKAAEEAHKVLAVERAKREHLKLLEVTGRPVVHEDHTKNVLLSLIDWYALAPGVAWADEECLGAKLCQQEPLTVSQPEVGCCSLLIQPINLGDIFTWIALV